MALAAALASVTNAITAIPANGLANGNPYADAATPQSSHVRSHLKWPYETGGGERTIVDHVCRYARVDLAAGARNAVAEKTDVETGVIIAIARAAAARYYGWNRASMNAAELENIADGTAALTVHADHEADVAAALTVWADPAARYMGLFFYNSISMETASHHHLPRVTKRLAKTTITLSGLKDFIQGDAEREGAIFHDTFHPLAPTVKSQAARMVRAKDHLSDLKFDNLRKRIPVKAPDSGVAINYSTLYKKAKAYRHVLAHIPDDLAPPANLAAKVRAYEAAADAAALSAAVTDLRTMSDALAEPSAYLAGFILGCEARATGDKELTLDTASDTCTILGCPAYGRAAGEFSGSFAFGKENGYKAVPSGTPDQVLPRVAAAVTRAGTL